MTHKKKKTSNHQLQKLAAAQYKNEFFRKFNYLFRVFCDEKLYLKIPTTLLEEIYSTRSHSLRAVAAEGNHISKAFIEKIKADITLLLKNDTISIAGKGIEISLYDFLTAGLSLIKFGYIIKDNEFAEAERIKEGLRQFKIDTEFDFQIRGKILSIIQTVPLWYNNMGKCQYWLKYEVNGFDNPFGGIYHLAYVYSHIPKSTSIKIDDIARPAFPFEWALPQTGPECLSIKPSAFNIKSPFAEIPMKVYIQNHALQKLAERIDGVFVGFAQYFMYVSFLNIKVFHDNHNNILVEYRLAETRAGYFRVDIIDGIMFVRTFLFITNNGTPEGHLLEKNSGLQKLDKKYLAIDKLSTFTNSDITDNKILCKLLDESGCHSLIELHEKMKNIVIKKTNHSLTTALFADYLRYDNSPTTYDI